jgi:uncharacterized protein YdeI (YjbR/CyaY-like superfamily)
MSAEKNGGWEVTENYSNLKRPRQIMPQDVQEALEQHGLMDEYLERPAYQRNDYLGWIKQAVLTETRQKRLQQMLDELEAGGVYMGMEHRPSTK